MITREEMQAVQRLLLHTRNGKVILRELHRIGHFDTTLSDAEDRIEYNAVRMILDTFGISLGIVAAQTLPPDAVQPQGEIDRILGLPAEERTQANG